MTKSFQDVVEGLVKAHAGGDQETPEDKIIVVQSLKEFAAGQQQRGVVLGIALVSILVAPIVLIYSSVPKEQLAYLLGGTGLFTAGTAKYLVDAMSEMSRAHALAIVCQGIRSADAREVLNAWLKANKR